MEFLYTMHQASVSIVSAAIESSSVAAAAAAVKQQQSDHVYEFESIRKLRQQALEHLLVPTSRHVHAVVELDMKCIYCGCHKPSKQVITGKTVFVVL